MKKKRYSIIQKIQPGSTNNVQEVGEKPWDNKLGLLNFKLGKMF